MDIQTIIDTYYQGWGKRNKAQARSVMADNMTHQAREGRFTDADNFIDTCWDYAPDMTGVRYIKAIYTKSEAFLILEWDTESGIYYGAEYLRVENNKIQEILVVNNVSPDLSKILNG